MSKAIVWSEYQKAIFANVANGKSGEHCIVDAKAGSGKTSVLLEALKHIPPKQSTLFLAFNTKISLELQDRAPSYSKLDISTVHSFGYRIIREAAGKKTKIRFDADKTFKIVKKLLAKDKKSEVDKDNYEAFYELQRIVALCKNQLVDAPSKIDELMDEFDIKLAGYDREVFIHRIIQTLAECKKQDTFVDYSDMVWLPVVFQLPIPQYDRVFIDEVQDCSLAQQYIAINACKSDGRILACGDESQTLYSFLGAKLDGITTLKTKLNATTFPLPISYRCSKKVIFEAQKIVPEITYAPNAIDGEVHHITEDQIISLIKPGDFLLSRTNAELVRLVFELWRAKIPANIVGRELGIGLTATIKNSKKKTVDAFLTWLEAWKTEEVARLKAKHRDYTQVLDRVECLKVLCEGKKTIEEVKEVIESLFEDKGKSKIVQLFSIHGSKGKEANSVFLLTSTLRFGNGQAEKNAEYVAKTRAKNVLYLVS